MDLNLSHQAGDNSFTIDLGDLAGGVYYLNISSGTERISLIFAKD